LYRAAGRTPLDSSGATCDNAARMDVNSHEE
jgi:hypothetical protein